MSLWIFCSDFALAAADGVRDLGFKDHEGLVIGFVVLALRTVLVANSMWSASLAISLIIAAGISVDLVVDVVVVFDDDGVVVVAVVNGKGRGEVSGESMVS